MQNRITKKPAYEEDKDLPGEAELDKAERLWQKYLCIDNSPITDLFGGQLQSTVHCHKCKGNFTTYEPFWDLSLPIVREGKGGLGAWLSGKSIPTTIQDCLQAFTADEVLQVTLAAEPDCVPCIQLMHSCVPVCIIRLLLFVQYTLKLLFTSVLMHQAFFDRPQAFAVTLLFMTVCPISLSASVYRQLSPNCSDALLHLVNVDSVLCNAAFAQMVSQKQLRPPKGLFMRLLHVNAGVNPECTCALL